MVKQMSRSLLGLLDKMGGKQWTGGDLNDVDDKTTIAAGGGEEGRVQRQVGRSFGMAYTITCTRFRV